MTPVRSGLSRSKLIVSVATASTGGRILAGITWMNELMVPSTMLACRPPAGNSQFPACVR